MGNEIDKLMEQLVENVDKLTDEEYDRILRKANQKFFVSVLSEEEVLTFGTIKSKKTYYSNVGTDIQYIQPNYAEVKIPEKEDTEVEFSDEQIYEIDSTEPKYFATPNANTQAA